MEFDGVGANTGYEEPAGCMEQWQANVCDNVGALLHSLPTRKAVGEDLIPCEFLRAAGPGYLKCLESLVRKVVLTQVVPRDWKGGSFCPVRKPRADGSDGSTAGFRGILLSSQVGKVLAKGVRAQIAPLSTAPPWRPSSAGSLSNPSRWPTV